ncbi:MAG: hypothetical protein ACK4HV_01005, partial [Parachlamydiaceae bacterium]
VALKLIDLLKAHDRLEPNKAKKSDLYKAARFFRKNVAPLCKPNAAFSALAKEEVAFGLGIEKSVLDNNKGLFEFAKETSFNNYLARYHDHLMVDENQLVSLRINPDKAKNLDLPYRTIRAKWNDIRSKVENELLPEARKEKFSSYFYSENGFTFEKFTRKIEQGLIHPLRLYRRKSNHKWGKRYVFEVCIHAEGDGPDIKKMHTWRRLKDPKGNSYSIGDYRPNEANSLYTCAPLLVRQQNPDSSEFTPEYFNKKLSVQITKEEFNKLKQIEESRLNGTFANKTFKNLNDNCTNKSLYNLQAIGIEVPNFTVSFWQAVFPNRIVKPLLKLHDLLPERIAKISTYALAILGNLVLPIFNGLKENPELPGVKATISSFKDILDPKNMDHTSPYCLVNGPLKELEKWREEVKKDENFLKSRGWTIEDVNYQVPDSWRKPKV